MLYPTEVYVNEQNIKKLTDTFKAAYKQIIDEIKSATDFGIANRRTLLRQIEQILEDLGTNVSEFIQEELPQYYEDGAYDAVRQLRDNGAPVQIETGFNRINRDAILALVDDTQRAFGEAISGVGRSANLVLGRAVRDQISQRIATGVISGSALREIRNNIVATLEDQGLVALIDKAGRAWELDRYAEMLIRTKIVEARNRGLVNRMLENGYDLVQVSSHNSAHEACRVWEGKILSLSGQTKGYSTVAHAESSGLFHPNCKHAMNAIVPELASLTKSYNQDLDTLTASELSKLGGKYADAGVSPM